MKVIDADSLPTPFEFYQSYATGAGTPVLIKGGAKKMPASQWTDEFLRENYGSLTLDKVHIQTDAQKATHFKNAVPGKILVKIGTNLIGS